MYKKKKVLKKFVSSMVAVSVVFSSVYMGSKPALASGNTAITTFESDGVNYIMYASESANERTVEVVNTETQDKFEVSLAKDYSEYEYEAYEYEGKTWYGASKYEKTQDFKEDLTQYNEDETDVVTAQYSWSKKKYDGWKEEFWYQAGSSGYGNEYMQIGCVASYRIPVYKLSDSKQERCYSFQEDIKKSIEYATSSKIALAGTGIGFDTLLVVIGGLGVATLGVGAIVTIVVALVGVGGSGVKYAVQCYKTYLDIDDTYAIIKNYGTKL